jgi:bacillithiol synthase
MPVASSPEPSAHLALDLRRFPGIRRLAADYAYDFAALAPFFAGDPAQRADWDAAIQRTREHGRQRQAIAAVLAAQQRRRGAPAAALEASARLGDAATVAIVTGQQAGLFGGPLFTLLKALTALKLVDRVSREHGVPAVGVFWIDAEDHDWEEVRATTVLDAELSARTITLPPRPASDPVPVGAIHLDGSIAAAVDELARALPPTEFQASLLGDLREIYAPGATMTDAFGRWLERVLGPRGLIVFDASDPAAKPLASEIFAREIAEPGRTARLAARAGADLAARGYHAQVHTQEDGLALFHVDGARRAVHVAHLDQLGQGQFVAGHRRFDAAALMKTARERPGEFSPNVLLRPIVQDTLFPTICYVAGPNELAYLGQLSGIYDRFRVPMPLMYLRASATILDSAAVRFLTKYRLSLEALQPQDESALNDLLETQIPASVEQALTGATRTIDAEMSRLVEVLPSIDPTLEGAAASTLGRMRHDLDTLHNKVIHAAKRRDETLRRQFIHARALAFPGGQAQERAIGFVSFLNQYGAAFVQRLDEELPVDLGRHWIVTI